MIARKGNWRLIQSNNDRNFLGVEHELKRIFLEMDKMGGVLERHTRSARSIFLSLLKTHSQSLNDESFHAFMAEVKGIANSRSVETLADVTSCKLLSPSDLFTRKPTIVLPPASKFY